MVPEHSRLRGTSEPAQNDGHHRRHVVGLSARLRRTRNASARLARHQQARTFRQRPRSRTAAGRRSPWRSTGRPRTRETSSLQSPQPEVLHPERDRSADRNSTHQVRPIVRDIRATPVRSRRPRFDPGCRDPRLHCRGRWIDTQQHSQTRPRTVRVLGFGSATYRDHLLGAGRLVGPPSSATPVT